MLLIILLEKENLPPLSDDFTQGLDVLKRHEIPIYKLQTFIDLVKKN